MFNDFGSAMGMGMLGVMEFVIIAAIVFAVIAKLRSGKKGMVHMALRKLEVNTDPSAEDVIFIEGRKTGLWAWLLVQLKLGNTYQLQVRKDDIRYLAESMSGKSLSLVPLQRVASTSCGYEKPVWWLILGIIFAVSSLSPLVFVTLPVAALCFIAYVYQQNFFIHIETVGSASFGFSFKRSFIENTPIDIERIEAAIGMINDMVKANK